MPWMKSGTGICSCIYKYHTHNCEWGDYVSPFPEQTWDKYGGCQCSPPLSIPVPPFPPYSPPPPTCTLRTSRRTKLTRWYSGNQHHSCGEIQPRVDTQPPHHPGCWRWLRPWTVSATSLHWPPSRPDGVTPAADWNREGQRAWRVCRRRHDDELADLETTLAGKTTEPAHITERTVSINVFHLPIAERVELTCLRSSVSSIDVVKAEPKWHCCLQCLWVLTVHKNRINISLWSYIKLFGMTNIIGIADCIYNGLFSTEKDSCNNL